MNVCKESPLCSIIFRAQVTWQQDRGTAVPEKTASMFFHQKREDKQNNILHIQTEQ